ncbi:hypothetical protein Hanom_Chr16g01452321 [Helianthus anomalus]
MRKDEPLCHSEVADLIFFHSIISQMHSQEKCLLTLIQMKTKRGALGFDNPVHKRCGLVTVSKGFKRMEAELFEGLEVGE